MHSLLEDYLAEVAAQMQPLPVKRRSEELREIRSHLENSFAVCQEQGGTEEEAAQSTLAQFGASETIGQETVAAWRRGENLRKRDFWGAAGCALALFCLLSYLLGPFADAALPHSGPANLHGLAVYLSWHYSIYLLAGGISGFLFPRCAVVGARLALALYLGFDTIHTVIWIAHVGHTQIHRPGMVGLSIVIQYAQVILLTLFAAWAGSRWHKARMGRMRLAQD